MLAHVQSLCNHSFKSILVVSLPPRFFRIKLQLHHCSVDSRMDFSNGKISNDKMSFGSQNFSGDACLHTTACKLSSVTN